MNSFWPTGVEITDMQPPNAILDIAREEWETNSGGVLTLVLQHANSNDHNVQIVVHAKHIPSNRTATLFTVIHRQNAPYPASIRPNIEALPDDLKRSYYKPGLGDLVYPSDMHGQTITNEWVSDTPSEFRKKLVEAFNLPVVKTTIFSLTSGDHPATFDGDKQPIVEHLTKE